MLSFSKGGRHDTCKLGPIGPVSSLCLARRRVEVSGEYEKSRCGRARTQVWGAQATEWKIQAYGSLIQAQHPAEQPYPAQAGVCLLYTDS